MRYRPDKIEIRLDLSNKLADLQYTESFAYLSNLKMSGRMLKRTRIEKSKPILPGNFLKDGRFLAKKEIEVILSKLGLQRWAHWRQYLVNWAC